MRDESNAAVDRTLQSTQIIGFSLAVAVAIFLAVTLVVRKDKPANVNEMLSYFGVLFAVLSLGAAAVVPTMVTKAGVQSVAESPSIESLAGVFQTSSIIRGALIEGAAFCNATFFLIFGDWLNFLVAASLLAVLVYFIPTRGRFLDWLRRQRESDL